MRDITPIRDEAAHDAALAEVRRLWGAEAGTKAGDHLEVLMILVEDYEDCEDYEDYESKHHAIDGPDPIEAIRIRMDELGLERADLGAMLGIASGRVSEILNHRRRLTIDLVRTLAAKRQLPERCLLQPYEPSPAPQSRRPNKAGKQKAA